MASAGLRATIRGEPVAAPAAGDFLPQAGTKRAAMTVSARAVAKRGAHDEIAPVGR
jgi:hypothetical protein